MVYDNQESKQESSEYKFRELQLLKPVRVYPRMNTHVFSVKVPVSRYKTFAVHDDTVHEWALSFVLKHLTARQRKTVCTL
jgi:hypothetical protein